MSKKARTGKWSARVLDDERETMEYRKAGLSLQAIADRMGCNKSTVQRRLDKYFEKVRSANMDDAEEIVNTTIERIDHMLQGIWARAVNGKLLDIDRVIKLEDQRLRLLGLYGPEKRELSGPGGAPMEYADARAALIAKLSQMAGDSETSED